MTRPRSRYQSTGGGGQQLIHRTPWLCWIKAVLFALSLAACTSTPARVSFTMDEQGHASVPGFEHVRFFANATIEELNRSPLNMRPMSPQGSSRPTFLALSGGGSGGAFGAGLLVGWTAAGSRPEFTVVTGVSTGALIAPFAFAGQAYDAALSHVYGSGVAARLARWRSPLAVLFGSESLLDPQPLEDLVEAHASTELLSAVAREYRRGRRLFAVTTNLDAQRPVVWDLGAIAAVGTPQALHLFRQVLIASASIPGVYPPRRIEVAAGTRRFAELHVDGGTTLPIFTGPELLLAAGSSDNMPMLNGATMFVVANNGIEPEFEVVPTSIISVALRSYSTFLMMYARTAINSAYVFTRRTRMQFYLAAVPRTGTGPNEVPLPYDPTNPFDPLYMRELFSHGYKQGRGGLHAFATEPPAIQRQPIGRRSQNRGVLQMLGNAGD